MDNCTNCGTIPTFADDSMLVITTTDRYTAQEKIVRKMEEITKILNNNSLTVNSGKLEILEIMVQQKRRWIMGTPPSPPPQTDYYKTGWYPKKTFKCKF